MKYIALLLILFVTLLVQNSIASKASPVPPPLSQNSIASKASPVPPPLSAKPLPKFSFECILGCTGACFSSGFQCFKKCFKECKNGRLSDQTNFLPKFNAIRNYQKEGFMAKSRISLSTFKYKDSLTSIVHQSLILHTLIPYETWFSV